MKWSTLTGSVCAAALARLCAPVSCVSAIAIWIAAPIAVTAQTFYVATNGNDDLGDGSLLAPWGSIGGGLAKLHDDGVDGVTLLVRPGTYSGRQRLVGTFAGGVTVRSESPYQARLRHSSQTVVGYANSRGVSGITIEGFDIAHSGPGASPLVFHIDGAGGNNGVGNITIRNNVIHDSYNNDLLKINNGVTNVTVERNMFYNQTGSDEHIDVNSVEDVIVRDNVFFNDFAGSGRTNGNNTGSYIVIKDSNEADDIFVGNDRITVQRNVFLNWEGSTGTNFVLIGEDGKPYIEARNVMVENNLMLGNSENVMRAALGVKSGEGVTFRNNTVAGDLPSLAFAMRVNVENQMVTNDNVNFYNNIWSDPTGTMGASFGGANDFSDSPPNEVDNWQLLNNLYYNGGANIPSNLGETINYTDDPNRILSDPQLPTQQSVVLPRWDSNQAVFADGSASIREAFVKLVERYGTPGANSGGVDQGRPELAPTDDILGNPRGIAPDIGAVELLETITADLDNDADVDGADFLLVQRNNPLLIPKWESAYDSGVRLLASSQAVPEPSGVMLILTIVLGGHARRESHYRRSRMCCCARILAFVFLLAHCLNSIAAAQTSTVRVATGVSRPVIAVAPPGDAGRLFIAEQHTGRIEIMDLGNGTISQTPFLDLGGLATSNEQGLLGLAFDPDYANNGYFYVNVTTAAGGGDTHIRRYTAQGDPSTSNVASLASQREILSINQPQGNHNGGWIDFSPTDGNLYIATGDGGGGDDNDSGHTAGIGNSQDISNNLLGKMLRIDVTGDDFPADASRNYAVPADNPFVNATGDDEIWAYGLRNPYRSSFDRANGDLWIGDVGQDFREEIDYQRAESSGGENYGWRLREGTIATPTGGVGGDPPPGNVEPIYDYSHGLGAFQGRVVIGGYVYRGPIEEFQGHYFFADSESHNIWKLDPDAIDPRTSVTRVNNDLLPDAGTIQFIGSFGEDAEGNLYIMEVFGGEIFRITSASQDILWNGDDATAGAAGDGVTWGDANNWTRDGTPDQGFVDEDHVIFVHGSSQPTIALGAMRTVSAATFESDFTLTGNTLRVLSGNVTVESSVTATIASVLEAESADHSVRKLGAGTLLVEGTAGQTVVKQGILGGTGTLDHLTVRNGGTAAPGASIGVLNVDNSFTMEEGATLSIEIGGTGSGEFDQLLVGGVAQLDGTLDVRLVGSYLPQVGDSIPFLVAQGGAGGTFDALDLPTLGPNLEWLINPGAISVFLFVNSTLEGDFDNDGDVDENDLATWETGFGATGGAGRSDGDADADLDVDGADFLFWQRQNGIAGAPGLASSLNVPEPITLLLAVGILFAQLAGRRRSN